VVDVIEQAARATGRSATTVPIPGPAS